MTRNGRSAHDELEWPDESEVPRGTGRSVGTWSWAGGGLMLGALVVLGLVAMNREPEKASNRVQFHRSPSPLGSVAFAPDGRTLAVGRADGGLEIQSLAGGRDREIEPGAGFGGLARGLAYSPDGKTLASGGLGDSVKLWDVVDGTLQGSLEGHSAPVGILAFSPDGRTIASAAVDGSVKLWDLASGLELVAIAGHTLEVRGLAFAPDGRTIASGSLDGSVKVWDVATGLERAGVRNTGRRVYGLAFAPDGQTLALGLGAAIDGTKGEVILWTPTESRQPFRVLGLASFAAVAFAPDGRTLAAAGGDRVVKLWDVATGRELASLTGHDGTIASLAFSPDGQALATAGLDKLVGLFELELAEPAGRRL